MKSVIKIPKGITLEKLEDLLVKLDKSVFNTDLEIPLTVDYKGFGILPGLYLVLFTWMRTKKGNIIIHLDIENTESIKNFSLDYYGYVILSTLWKEYDFVNREGVSIKKYFKEHTPSMHRYIDSLSKELPKESVMIPCFDHYSFEKGLSHWFYANDYSFSDTPSGLDNSLYHIITKLSINYKERVKRNFSDSFDSMSKIVWELLKNTDEHAKKDYLGEEKLQPNTRGLFMRIHRSSKKGFIDGTHHEGLKKYYRSSFYQEDADCFLLEISVFDSGPGIVKRFLSSSYNKNLTINEEINVVRKCLIKGQTSVEGTDGKNKGYGLDEVLNLLNTKRGFLKIRSGRCSIYRDLINSPYKLTQNEEEVELFDWVKSSNNNYSEMKTTEGTLITLVYPLL
ncbi:hypothetical protein CLU83_0515 [Flavobacterium sp. 1]|uniref:hypothetical protein n=1 Tax=Flavobacterium sp. 1 TaxID=2035200 RepID=UPI000C24A476|nr:hypothetical protein [Flavobacterium sp. 1]PJJ07352.1 hypothetical protein CLU83_0515 [Flavobacterium sp. 1]